MTALTSGSRAFHAAQWRRDESTSATPAAPAAAVNTENTVADASSPKATALKWLEAVPGQDKAYNVLVGTSLAAILLGKEIVPYTADMVYAIPFSAAIYIAYGQLGPMIGDLVKSVFTVRGGVRA